MFKIKSKKVLKASLMFISFLLAGGSLLYKAQTNVAKAVSEPDLPLESINLVDQNDMTLNENTTIVGNVLQFGPSIGAFVSYKSKKTYTSLKMEFDTCLDPNLNPDWQRIVLRGDEISVANAGETKGYFVCLYKDNYHLYKQEKKSEYISLKNEYYSTSALGANSGNIYTGTYHHFNFECYNSDGSVVITMDINGHREFTYVDNGSELGKGSPLLEAGFAGLYMNSTDASWLIRSEITDAGFKENIFLGNVDTYNIESSAKIETGKLTFKNNEYALVNDETSIAETEFNFKASNKASDNKIMSIASFSNRQPAKSYTTNDGIMTDIYSNEIKITYDGEVKETIDVSSQLNVDVNVKYIAFYIANQVTIALKVGGTWYTVDIKNVANRSGYLALYGHCDVIVTAKEKANRNFRILFIGNSITNHGPNADLNYHIGAGSDSWAMATSAPEYDYVHRTVAAVRSLPGYENTEFLAINVANWEHDISLYDYANVYQAGAEFEADLIVGRLGENVTSAPSAIHMEYFYGRLLDFFNSTGNAKIILTTKYWGSENHLKDDSVDMGIINLARNRNYPLVRLNDLGSQYASINNATADQEYYYGLEGTAPGGLSWKDEFDGWQGGVKEHPGMVGHENIAARVSECVIRVIKGETVNSISKLDPIDEELSVEYNTSNIKTNEPGAYDYAKVSRFIATPMSDTSAYTFAKNYILYKAFNIDTDGVPYRFQMELQEDTTAQLTYKCYTFDSDNKSLKEIKCSNTADSYRDGYLYIEGNVNKALFITIEYDINKIFSANVFQDPKYAPILNFINKDNTNYVLDLTTTNSRYVTISKDVFSVLISSGRDIEIRLKDGTFLVERKTFEVMSMANTNLNFCIEKFTSENDIKNATSVIDKYPGVYGLETTNNQVTSIYEAQIAYNGRNGEPLYLSSGVKVLINKTLTDEEAKNLAIVTANLPAVGNEVTNIGALHKNKVSYENGVISINLNDFSKDLILALSEYKEGIAVRGEYKTTYELNEELDISGMKLVYVNLLGEETPLELTKDMIKGFDSSKDGTTTITITYKDFTTTVELTILAPKGGGCGGSVASMSLLITGLSIGAIALLPLFRRKQRD